MKGRQVSFFSLLQGIKPISEAPAAAAVAAEEEVVEVDTAEHSPFQYFKKQFSLNKCFLNDGGKKFKNPFNLID